jgi:hypothetical protein
MRRVELVNPAEQIVWVEADQRSGDFERGLPLSGGGVTWLPPLQDIGVFRGLGLNSNRFGFSQLRVFRNWPALCRLNGATQLARRGGVFVVGFPVNPRHSQVEGLKRLGCEQRDRAES